MARSRFPLAGSPDSDLRLHPYLAIVARHWALVLVALIVGALVALGLSALTPKGYTARATLYFSINYGDSGSDLNQGATYAQSQMLSFAELARSSRVLDPVIDELELDTSSTALASSLDVRTPENTVVLDIDANSANPEFAADLANATAASLTDAVQDVAPRNDSGRATVTVRTVETADTPTVPTSPNTRVNVVAGALLGLVIAILFIVARRLLDTRVRTTTQLETATALPVLASIEEDPRAGEGLVLVREPSHPAAEGYRRLRAVIEALRRSKVRPTVKTNPATTIAVTATNAGEGTTTVAANLAAALDEAGYSVLLVGGSAPSSSVTAIESWPGSVVTTAAVAELLRENSSDFDVIIVDAPDLANSSSTLTIGQLVDGVVLVARRDRVHAGELRASVGQLAVAGVSPIGTVLTGVQSSVPRVREPRGARSRVLPVLQDNEA
jgi:capsular polysaccharide biosynthesis protein